MKHIFFLILTTLAFLTCTQQEKAQKRALFCYIRYDEGVNKVNAEASLQDATNKTSLEIPNGIYYQGMEMKLTPVYGMTYRYEYTANFLPEHAFEWRDKKNESLVFKMRIDPIQAFSLTDKTISQSEPTTLQWQGTPLGKGETMVLMWENTSKGLTVPMEVSTTSGQSLIEIPAAKLNEIALGNWTLYLVRKKLTKEVVSDLPVNGIMEYYTKTIPVKIVE